MASKPIVIDINNSVTNVIKVQPKPLPKTSKNNGDTLNNILSSLECPACNEIFQSPILICSMGHNICGGCKSKPANNSCFICKNIITDQRNLALEDIIDKCASKCSNEKFGCKYVSIKEKIQSHQKNCTFLQTKCPYGIAHNQCKWEGIHSGLVTHFQISHPNKMLIKAGPEMKLKNIDLNVSYQDLQLVKYGTIGNFIYHFDIDLKNNVANWALQKTKSNDSKVCYYDFSLYHNKKTMKIAEVCAPMSSTLKTIFQSGNCISIPLNVLKNYINAEKDLTLKINIRS